VTDPHQPASCRYCGRHYPLDELDAHGWCARCKTRVIRQGTWVGRMAGIAVALFSAVAVAILVQPTRFMAGWMALLVGIYVFVTKLVRRVFVELRLNRVRSTRRGSSGTP
jgi:hypothetical protein